MLTTVHVVIMLVSVNCVAVANTLLSILTSFFSTQSMHVCICMKLGMVTVIVLLAVCKMADKPTTEIILQKLMSCIELLKDRKMLCLGFKAL